MLPKPRIPPYLKRARYFRIGLLLSLAIAPMPVRGPQTLALPSGSALIIYVDVNSRGPLHDGLSWTTAYTNVQDALATAVTGQEIWVADGAYYPDEGNGHVDNDQEANFQLKTGVGLYGGFGGYGISETVRSERQVEVYPTVLSGDLDQNDIATITHIVTNTANLTGLNSNHVLSGSYVDATAVLDGFFITAGSSSGCGAGCIPIRAVPPWPT